MDARVGDLQLVMITEHFFRRCITLYFLFFIVLNVPIKWYTLIAFFLIFKLGNASLYKELYEDQDHQPLFKLKITSNGFFLNWDPDINDHVDQANPDIIPDVGPDV